MNEPLSSIWDNWQRQCFGKLYDHATDAWCARGYAEHYHYGDGVVAPTYERVATWIKQHYSVSAITDYLVIVEANNVLQLTPEQFREIDRLSQVEEATKPLIESVSEEELSLA